jgi:transposase-like protein
MLKELNLPALNDALNEIEFFERRRTDRGIVELALVLYNAGLSLRKVELVLSWLGVERSHVSIWRWVVKFGQRLTATGRRPVAAVPPRVMLDETVVRQRGQEFTLFAALDPATRRIVHLNVYPVRNYLTTRLFLTEIEHLYGTVPSTIVTDDAQEYGDAFVDAGVFHVVFRLGPRTRIERWFQELKRRLNVFYASFSGSSVDPTRDLLRQFVWFWNECLT